MILFTLFINTFKKMTTKLFTIDDNFELDWVEVDLSKPMFDNHKKYFNVVVSKDGYTDFKFWNDWIGKNGGVWFEKITDLSKRIKTVSNIILEQKI